MKDAQHHLPLSPFFAIPTSLSCLRGCHGAPCQLSREADPGCHHLAHFILSLSVPSHPIAALHLGLCLGTQEDGKKGTALTSCLLMSPNSVSSLWTETLSKLFTAVFLASMTVPAQSEHTLSKNMHRGWAPGRNGLRRCGDAVRGKQDKEDGHSVSEWRPTDGGAQ